MLMDIGYAHRELFEFVLKQSAHFETVFDYVTQPKGGLYSDSICFLIGWSYIITQVSQNGEIDTLFLGF